MERIVFGHLFTSLHPIALFQSNHTHSMLRVAFFSVSFFPGLGKRRTGGTLRRQEILPVVLKMNFVLS
jgi:hypothetical protein